MSDIQGVSPDVFEKVAAVVGDTKTKPVNNARQSSMADKFRLYGLYKRATVGKLMPPYDDQEDVETEKRPKSRPSFLNYEGRGKYDNWLEADKLTKQQARDEYVKLAVEVTGDPVSNVLAK